jgi:fructoselysine-6-P-deglycase FrlB-like protein
MSSQLLAAKEDAVLSDMRALGGQTLSIGPTTTADMQWDATVPEACNGMIALPLVQSIAYSRATARGLNPDQPTNLNAVVFL